jgi:septum formation protein
VELVLASGSVWRWKLLTAAGIPCRPIAPNVNEKAIIEATPAATARARAGAKARAVAEGLGAECLVIGADQVVHLEGCILGKPPDRGAHLSMLMELRGRQHELVTAVSLVRAGPEVGEGRDFDVRTRLTMRGDLSDDELRAYVACGEASGCGGGYMIEALGAQLFEAVDGDWNNVVGLPLFRLISELRGLGWRPRFQQPAASVVPPG